MQFDSYRPGPPLSRFVDSLWLYQSEPQPYACERALPTGAAQIVINLVDEENPSQHPSSPHDAHHDQRGRGALLQGAYSTYFHIRSDQPEWRIGIQFRPGGAYPFFAPPASAVHDTHIALDALWGVQAQELRERLVNAATPETQFPLLEQFLLAQAVRPLEHHPAVAFALGRFSATPQPSTMAQIAQEIGLSHNRFIQVFRDEVGLTPKQFCRIRRFLGVLRRAHAHEHVAWAQVALECGYYDQAHLSNDFRALTGVCPSAYLRMRFERFLTYVMAPS